MWISLEAGDETIYAVIENTQSSVKTFLQLWTHNKKDEIQYSVKIGSNHGEHG